MKAQKMERARRQRIPAFGEWNYAYADGAADWPVTQYFESGVHAGRLVVAIPPSPPKLANKVVKWREESATLELEDDDDDEKEKQRRRRRRRRQHVMMGLGDGDGDHHAGAVKKQGKQQRQSTVVHAYEAVKAIDQDLYHIPPDMLCHDDRRKRLTRRRTSLWMGCCLGLNCVVA